MSCVGEHARDRAIEPFIGRGLAAPVYELFIYPLPTRRADALDHCQKAELDGALQLFCRLQAERDGRRRAGDRSGNPGWALRRCNRNRHPVPIRQDFLPVAGLGPHDRSIRRDHRTGLTHGRTTVRDIACAVFGAQAITANGVLGSRDAIRVRCHGVGMDIGCRDAFTWTGQRRDEYSATRHRRVGDDARRNRKRQDQNICQKP